MLLTDRYLRAMLSSVVIAFGDRNESFAVNGPFPCGGVSEVSSNCVPVLLVPDGNAQWWKKEMKNRRRNADAARSWGV